MDMILYSRLYILYFIFNIGGWVYFGYLHYYTTFITAENCNHYTNELTEVIKAFVGMTMCISIINLVNASLIRRDYYIQGETSYLDNLYCPLIFSFFFLSVASIFGLVIFIISSGMSDIQCDNNNAIIGIQLSVYGVLWVAILELLLMVLSILSFLYDIIIDAKLHLLFSSCKQIYNKYKVRKIGIEISVQTDTYNNNSISIPIDAFKENNKIVCCICYENGITLLLEPCNHICICEDCYKKLDNKNCPLCKNKINMIRKIYLLNPDL